MAEAPGETAQTNLIQQTDFEQITKLVSAHFQSQESFLEHGIPTYYLRQPQETKRAFLSLLKNLEPMNLIAILRKTDGKVVLRVVPKPPVRKSNTLVNWALFFATIGTTFATGYILSDGLDVARALVGAAAFAVAILAILGTHEMGHKLTANRNGVEATPPYFIPGLPPIGDVLGIGTFGAVIMQKSLPPNKDALFDVGSSGPIVGFIVALIVTVVGLMLSPILPTKGSENFLPAPLIFDLLATFLIRLPANHYISLHPVAFAGWAGVLVTMLNLLPAGQLDGGHAARSVLGEGARTILTVLSVLLLVIEGFWPMAFFVVLMSMYRHPGPLDDVSSLSNGRKLLAVALVAIFILCSFLQYYVLALLNFFGV